MQNVGDLLHPRNAEHPNRLPSRPAWNVCQWTFIPLRLQGLDIEEALNLIRFDNDVWNIAEGLPTVIVDGSTQYVTDGSGLPIEQIAGQNVYYFHRDQLGSTRALSNSAGTTVATYTYDAYGNATVTGTITNPFQFAGQYTDAESGLSYMRARYYDPAAGQFVSRDAASSTTRQPYSYTDDNSLNAIDPSGLDWWNQALSWGFGQAANVVGMEHAGAVTVAKAALGYGAETAGDLGSHDPGRMAVGAANVALVAAMFFPPAFSLRAVSTILLREAVEGVGRPIIGAGTRYVLRAAGRLAEEYGGEWFDWAKMTTRSCTAEGKQIAVHWYENLETGVRTEFKTKLEKGFPWILQ